MSIDGMTVEGTVELLDLHPAQADLEQLVRQGMTKTPRQLPAWLLYDSEGSRLFAAICEQPEYTLTRNEISLLHQQADAIATAVGPGVLVEFGIGNAQKVSPRLKAMQSDLFVGLDICRSALRDALHGLSHEHPQTTMLGVCCDHSQLSDLPQHPRLEGQRRIGFSRAVPLAISAARRPWPCCNGSDGCSTVDLCYWDWISRETLRCWKPPTTMRRASPPPSPAIC